ncbi:MAG TPA: thioredoxin-disulfide reductase [Firmicutes bacterium]|nr:thioredoxin-disulfide reductase [Bacillota bacterium]
MKDIHEVIIIGSGPAGLTAAIYTARAGLTPLVFSGPTPGGQLTTTSLVENFPGFPEGITGPELMDKMREQASRFDARFEDLAVTAVDFSSRPFKVTAELPTGDPPRTWESKAIIIATGAATKKLGLPSEEALWGRGVSACATCDGFFFRDKKVAVVGGGDTAMEEALFLTKFARQVTVVHRRDKLRASQILQQRAFNNSKIDFAWNSTIQKVLGEEEGRVTGLLLQDTITGALREFSCDGLFLAIGHLPNTEIFKGQLPLTEDGYIIVHDRTKTAIPGVFVAGDVADQHYRQAITAAATGCMAAMDCEKWLASVGSN